jgi:TolA-binding protein
MKSIILVILSLSLAGCLVTRQEVRDSVRREPLTPEQQSKAQSEIRNQELEQQLREMNGRIETLENSLNMVNAQKSGANIEQQNEKKAQQEKLKIYEEAIGKLETQYLLLAQKLEALQHRHQPQKVMRRQLMSWLRLNMIKNDGRKPSSLLKNIVRRIQQVNVIQKRLIKSEPLFTS